jgi:hypothetical protein
MPATSSKKVELGELIARDATADPVEPGAVRLNGAALRFHDGTRVVSLGKQLIATATLNAAAPGAVPGSSDVTMAVTGAAIGDPVAVAAPVAVPANFILTAFVSAANTVTIRWLQYAGTATDPDGTGGTYRVVVMKA